MILVSIKVPILKKPGILFYDPLILAHRKKSLETYLMILVSVKGPIQKNQETFYDSGINVPIGKKSVNIS